MSTISNNTTHTNTTETTPVLDLAATAATGATRTTGVGARAAAGRATQAVASAAAGRRTPAVVATHVTQNALAATAGEEGTATLPVENDPMVLQPDFFLERTFSYPKDREKILKRYHHLYVFCVN